MGRSAQVWDALLQRWPEFLRLRWHQFTGRGSVGPVAQRAETAKSLGLSLADLGHEPLGNATEFGQGPAAFGGLKCV